MSNPGQTIHRPLQVAWTFGRSTACDVVINESAVSNRHGRLTSMGDHFVVEDLGSTNGIYVNGQRIDQPTVVTPNMPVSLGQRTPFPWLSFPIDFDPSIRSLIQFRDSQVEPSEDSSSGVSPSPDDETVRRALAGSPADDGSLSNRVVPVVRATGKQTLVVGRNPEGDVFIDEPTISWQHAEVEIRDGLISLIDLGSSNGIFRHASEQRVISLTIGVAEHVYLGAYRVGGHEMAAWFNVDPSQLETTSKVQAPRSDGPLDTVNLGKRGERKVTLVSDSSEIDHSEPPKFITIPEHPVILGRDPAADYVMNYPMISWRHARIWREGETILIEDLGSTNGTYVNGRRVTHRHEVRPGDAIALGSYRITFNQVDAGIDLVAQDRRGALTLEARNVTVQVPGKTLLENVSLTIEPGEFVGLMGPSGSGKSTLISALNGYHRPSDGAVLLDGFDLHEDYDLFRGQIGYVPQDDIMHPDLTVGQALYYTARLRLPPDFSDEEIERRINDVLNQLGLAGTQDTLIGSPDRRGISGGQRKRVNLAMELLTDPSILFLDEPTSGLSSVDTMVVMNLLRDLANRGKTILLTIHQPSMEAYQKLDHLLLIAKDNGSNDPGCLAFFGPAYPDAINYFQQHSNAGPNSTSNGPDEMLSILNQKPSHVWVGIYGQSSYRSTWVTQRQGKTPPASTKRRNRLTRGWGVRQAWTLTRRNLKLKLRDRANSLLLLAQAPVIAFLIAIVFGKKAAQTEDWTDMASATATTLFLVALSSIWCGCSNAVREIVAERAIYKRERMVNLKIPSYIFGKLSVLLLLSLVQTIIMLGIVYPTTGLDGPWWLYLIILMMTSTLGIAIGLAVSSLTRSTEFAVATLPLIILPNVMLGGVLMPIQEMPQMGQWVSYIVPSRWSFEALVNSEADAKPSAPAPETMAPETMAPETMASSTMPPADIPAGTELSAASQDASLSSPDAAPTESDSEAEQDTQLEDNLESPQEIALPDIAERFFPEADRNTVALDSLILLGMTLAAFAAVALFLKRRDG